MRCKLNGTLESCNSLVDIHCRVPGCTHATACLVYSLYMTWCDWDVNWQSWALCLKPVCICYVQDDPRWQLADPICTFIFAILVLLTTKAILRDISDILMERVPRQMDIAQLEQGMLAVSCCCSPLL